MSYAAGTTVSPEQSRAEIERLLSRYGAERFASGWDQGGASVLFDFRGRRGRFTLPMPALPLPGVDGVKRPQGWLGWNTKRREEWQIECREAEVRRRWRALVLVLKAKLEAVATGVASFDEEFLAHFVLPNGTTVGEWAIPQLDALGNMPPLLPGASS